MSIYYCHECDEQKDADYDFCAPDPRNDTDLICEDCIEKLSCYMPDIFGILGFELGEKQGGRNERAC